MNEMDPFERLQLTTVSILSQKCIGYQRVNSTLVSVCEETRLLNNGTTEIGWSASGVEYYVQPRIDVETWTEHKEKRG